MSSISSFDIIIVVVLPEPKNFLCISGSAADAAAVNPNGVKTLLANSWITFFINGKPVLSNGLRSLTKNPTDHIILDNLVFDSLISVDDLLAKAFGRFATYVLVDNNLCGKLFSSSGLTIIFNDNHKTTAVLFFIADFNLLTCEFAGLAFKMLYWVILY